MITNPQDRPIPQNCIEWGYAHRCKCGWLILSWQQQCSECSQKAIDAANVKVLNSFIDSLGVRTMYAEHEHRRAMDRIAADVEALP